MKIFYRLLYIVLGLIITALLFIAWVVVFVFAVARWIITGKSVFEFCSNFFTGLGYKLSRLKK